MFRSKVNAEQAKSRNFEKLRLCKRIMNLAPICIYENTAMGKINITKAQAPGRWFRRINAPALLSYPEVKYEPVSKKILTMLYRICIIKLSNISPMLTAALDVHAVIGTHRITGYLVGGIEAISFSPF